MDLSTGPKHPPRVEKIEFFDPGTHPTRKYIKKYTYGLKNPYVSLRNTGAIHSPTFGTPPLDTYKAYTVFPLSTKKLKQTDFIASRAVLEKSFFELQWALF